MVSILIIEADPWLCDGLCEALNLEGFKPVGVQGGKDGLAEIMRLSPPLILCDSILPDMNGYDVIRQVRLNPETTTIPIIFLTCFTARNYIRQALYLGANDCLLKPFDIDEMFRLVHKYMPIEQ